MAIRFYRNKVGERDLKTFTITNGQTLSVGEAVGLTSGLLTTVGAGNPVVGFCVGFLDSKGAPIDGAMTEVTGGTSAYQAVVDCSPFSEYIADLDDTIGTTTGSNLAGYNFDFVASGQTLDESTSATTSAQFVS